MSPTITTWRSRCTRRARRPCSSRRSPTSPGLIPDSFWFNLDNRGWTHPFDEHGRRCSYADIPKSVTGLTDDPYRSLAGELRLAGGYAKDTTPFSEFLWADYLRRRIKPKIVTADFDAAVAHAIQLAKSEDADYLPGWSGTVAR